MKKLLVLICTALMVFSLCVLPIVANAEPPTTEAASAGKIIAVAGETAPAEMPVEFSWKYLITTGGAAVFVYFVVQFAKAPLDKVGHIPTRLLVYVLCLITLVVANIFMNHGINVETVALCVFNALISAYGAYGMYEVWAKKRE